MKSVIEHVTAVSRLMCWLIFDRDSVICTNFIVMLRIHSSWKNSVIRGRGTWDSTSGTLPVVKMARSWNVTIRLSRKESIWSLWSFEIYLKPL